MEAKNLLPALLNIADGELKLLGFRKTRGVYVREAEDGSLGWVGINAVAHRSDGKVGINPMVGVRHKRIEEMIAEFATEEETGVRPTISSSLGYLMPECRYLEWLFEPSPFDYQSECRRMVKAIEVYGVPFMNSNTKLRDIVRALEVLRFAPKDVAVYKLPVAYMLSGRIGEASAYVQNQLKELGERKDIAARQYRTFASNLLLEASVKN